MGVLFGDAISTVDEIDIILHAIEAWGTSNSSIIQTLPGNVISSDVTKDTGLVICRDRVDRAYESAQLEILKGRAFYPLNGSNLSVFKCAAHMLDALYTHSVIGYQVVEKALPLDDLPSLRLLENAANADCAWNVCMMLLADTELIDRSGERMVIEHQPTFVSRHFQSECYLYFISEINGNRMRVNEIALLLELLTYHNNPDLVGIRDSLDEDYCEEQHPAISLLLDDPKLKTLLF